MCLFELVPSAASLASIKVKIQKDNEAAVDLIGGVMSKDISPICCKLK